MIFAHNLPGSLDAITIIPMRRPYVCRPMVANQIKTRLETKMALEAQSTWRHGHLYNLTGDIDLKHLVTCDRDKITTGDIISRS